MTTDGLVLIDKPSGMTSHDVVAVFRRAAKIKKAGHSGTLDPMATGLLVVCSGKATRLQSYFMGMEKTYEGEIQFGWATNTYDAEGEAIGEPTAREVSHVDFPAAVKHFTGAIEQVPPAFSAKKIDGKRSYAMARAGEVVKLEPKRVNVYEFVINDVIGSVARFRARVSAGTYIRSLAHDLGVAISVPAHLKSLRRISIGNFDVRDAITLEKLRESSPETIFAPPHFKRMADAELPMARVWIDALQEKRITHGQSIVASVDGAMASGADVALISLQHEDLIAVATVARVVRDGVVELAPKAVL